jgi:DHA1 family tetracycline resistance protein-like MFS transporter
MDCGTVCERTRLLIDTPPHSEVTPADKAPTKTLNGDDPQAPVAGVVVTTSSAPHAASPNTDDFRGDEPTATLCGCCCKWKAPLLLAVFIFLSNAPSMLTSALMIKVNKDYFGSDQRAGLITSILVSFIAAINLFMVTPYGRLIDTLGRRPFFIAFGVMTVVQFALLVAFQRNPVPYLIAMSVGTLIQQSYQSAFIADCVPAHERGFAFNIVQGFGSLSMFCALPIGVINAPDWVFFVAGVVFSVLSLLFAIFCIPESLPHERREKFSWRHTIENPLKGTKILLSSRGLVVITAAACLVTLADIGTLDIAMYYLNDRVGFSPQDIGIFYAEMGVLSLVSLFVLYPIARKRVSTLNMLRFSMACNAVMDLVSAVVWARWLVFALIAPIYAGVTLWWPLLATLVSTMGPDEDVGKRITATTALTDFCRAAGPLLFSLLYGLLPKRLENVAFFLACGLSCIATFLLWHFLDSFNCPEPDDARVVDQPVLIDDERHIAVL